MKAKSAGLEIQIELNDGEISDLRHKSLRGTLNFDDTMLPSGSMKRHIPLEIIYTIKDSDSIKVRQFPQGTYFGFSERVIVNIYNYHYKELMQTGTFEDVFLHGGGRVTMIKS